MSQHRQNRIRRRRKERSTTVRCQTMHIRMPPPLYHDIDPRQIVLLEVFRNRRKCQALKAPHFRGMALDGPPWSKVPCTLWLQCWTCLSSPIAKYALIISTVNGTSAGCEGHQESFIYVFHVRLYRCSFRSMVTGTLSITLSGPCDTAVQSSIAVVPFPRSP